jgi:hypothetical protein
MERERLLPSRRNEPPANEIVSPNGETAPLPARVDGLDRLSYTLM